MPQEIAWDQMRAVAITGRRLTACKDKKESQLFKKRQFPPHEKQIQFPSQKANTE